MRDPLPPLSGEHAGTSGAEMRPAVEVSVLAGAEPRSIVMLMSQETAADVKHLVCVPVHL